MGTDIAVKAIVSGARIIAATAVDLVMNLEILSNAKEELLVRLKGRVYQSLIPEGVEPPITLNADAM